MAGLRLNMGIGGAATASEGSGYSSVPSPSTATAAAFGPGYAASGTPSTSAALTPNDPFGVAFWVGIASVMVLIVIRQSLPT